MEKTEINRKEEGRSIQVQTLTAFRKIEVLYWKSNSKTLGFEQVKTRGITMSGIKKYFFFFSQEIFSFPRIPFRKIETEASPSIIRPEKLQ